MVQMAMTEQVKSGKIAMRSEWEWNYSSIQTMKKTLIAVSSDMKVFSVFGVSV